MIDLRIQPMYGADITTAVNTYQVVSLFNEILFIGTYMECYNFRSGYLKPISQ
jgi:hypothetical protein